MFPNEDLVAKHLKVIKSSEIRRVVQVARRRDNT
jgi:hypothetical protein